MALRVPVRSCSVENLSRSWTVILVEFDVLPSANADAVLDLTRRIAREMAEEATWNGVILNPNEWSGVSKLTLSAMTVVIAVRTRPLKHWDVGRDLRRRLKNALDIQEAAETEKSVGAIS